MKSFAFLLTAILLNAASAAEPPLRVIDAHTHTDFDGKPEHTSGIIDSQEQYFKEMKAAGVVGAVELTSEYERNYVDLRKYNVVSCAGIREDIREKELEDGLKSGKYGCMKIYLGYVYHYAYDPIYEPIYKLAEKYDVPVVFHTGDTYSTRGKLKYSHPMAIDEVAVDHPKVRFVMAHCGYPWIETAADIAYKNPNVYLDGSAFLIGDLSKMPKEKVDKFVVEPLSWIFGYLEDPTKLMYGTDWPLTDMASYLDAFKRAIPKEHWNAVFHDNAVRVFKLKP